MAHTQEYLEALMELGLDRYEAQACVALYTHGPLTPHDLSKLSHIPKSWVYSVLKSLVEKGWVEALQGRPRVFRPVPMASLLPKIRRQLSEKAERTLSLLEELGSKRGEWGEAISALVYYGEEKVAAKAAQLLSEASEPTLVLNHYWARRLAAKKTFYFGRRPYGLLVLEDAVFLFVGGKGFPAFGVLAYSRPLALTVKGLVSEQLRLGRLRAAGRQHPG